MTEFLNEFNYHETTTTTSESDPEDVVKLFSTADTSDKYVTFKLDGGNEYQVKSHDLDICGLSQGIIFTQKDIITILTSCRNHPYFVSNLETLQILSPRMDDTCCNIMIDLIAELVFPRLRVFSLFGCSMNTNTFLRMMKNVSKDNHPNLEEFTIGKMEIGDDVFLQAMSEFDIASIGNINVLIFNDINIGDKCKDLIISYLNQQDSYNLRFLDLADEAKEELKQVALKHTQLQFMI